MQAERWPLNVPTSGVLSIFYDDTELPSGVVASDKRYWVVTIDATEQARQTRCPPGVRVYAELPLVAASGAGDGPLHQLGGIPSWIQSPSPAIGHFLSGAYLEHDDVVAALRKAGVAAEALIQANDLLETGRRLDHAGTEPAQLAAGLVDWTPLLQIDSDPRTGFMWGDVGRLYLFADRLDLSRRSARSIWIVLQYY